MSVRVTDKRNVALYCSTTGQAFGPTFDSESDAHDFLEWLAPKTVVDPREIPWRELNDLQYAWSVERETAVDGWESDARSISLPDIGGLPISDPRQHTIREEGTA